jgi:hypothetical protein
MPDAALYRYNDGIQHVSRARIEVQVVFAGKSELKKPYD